MTPQRLEKIQRLANDSRGDPATRAIAQAVLRRYAKPEPKPTFKDVPRDPRVHGLRRNDPVYEYRVYCDLAQWDITKAGNPTYVVYHKGISYRIVLFEYKRSNAWGWMRVDPYHDQTEFSGRFHTIGEAQKNAWDTLMKS